MLMDVHHDSDYDYNSADSMNEDPGLRGFAENHIPVGLSHTQKQRGSDDGQTSITKSELSTLFQCSR